MAEIELRAKTTKDIHTILKAANATQKYQTRQVDEYFKFEKDETRQLVIRIRKKKGKEVLTFKGKTVASEDIAWPEWECEIENGHQLKALLLSNGLVPVVTIDKERTSYELDGYEINVDEIVDLGTFVEVEIQAEDHEDAKQRIMAIFHDKLHILPSHLITQGYVPLMLHKMSEKKN